MPGREGNCRRERSGAVTVVECCVKGDMTETLRGRTWVVVIGKGKAWDKGNNGEGEFVRRVG